MRLRKKKGPLRSLLGAVFLLYLIVLAYLLFFSSTYGRTLEAGYRCNLVPMLEIMRGLKNIEKVGVQYILVNIVGNVAAFMPFGFLVPYLSEKKHNVVTILVLTFFFSLTVEVLQYVTRTGAFDVDDLILNSIGGVLGYVCYWILTWRRKQSR